MEKKMLDSNYLIINRHAAKFREMKIAGHTAVFIGNDGKVLDYGAVRLGDKVYAALCCDEVRNISLVMDGEHSKDVVTLLWLKEDDYAAACRQIGDAAGQRLSKQNRKINRYAEAVAEKLALGVKLRITDAADSTNMVKCPECGILNPPGSEYCLDCGAAI
jgi:hypothetical protein